MGEENINRNSARGRYPAVHGASGYSSQHVSAVLVCAEGCPPKDAMPFGELYAGWCRLVLSPLWVFWGRVL
jgi:hypothetical protein